MHQNVPEVQSPTQATHNLQMQPKICILTLHEFELLTHST